MNILKIGEQEYFLPEVLLYLDHRGRPEDGLMFSLYADPADLQQAGLAINSMSVPGRVRIDHLCFELNTARTDTLNELGESVICEPGAALELMSLHLVFGAVHGTAVPITLDAVCRTRSGASIPARGEFAARVLQEETPNEPTTQLAFPI